MWEALALCSGRSCILVHEGLVPAACFGHDSIARLNRITVSAPWTSHARSAIGLEVQTRTVVCRSLWLAVRIASIPGMCSHMLPVGQARRGRDHTDVLLVTV